LQATATVHALAVMVMPVGSFLLALRAFSTLEETPKYNAADNDRKDKKEGDHVGGQLVEAGDSMSRKGHYYSGGTYISCCGEKQKGEDDVGPYSLNPCSRGQGGMY